VVRRDAGVGGGPRAQHRALDDGELLTARGCFGLEALLERGCDRARGGGEQAGNDQGKRCCGDGVQGARGFRGEVDGEESESETERGIIGDVPAGESPASTQDQVKVKGRGRGRPRYPLRSPLRALGSRAPHVASGGRRWRGWPIRRRPGRSGGGGRCPGQG